MNTDMLAALAAVEIAKLEARIEAMEKINRDAVTLRPQSFMDEIVCLKAELAALFTLYRAAM